MKFFGFLILFLPATVLAQPTNDNLANAINITTVPFSDVVTDNDAFSASFESNEVICVDTDGSTNSWWYQFTPTNDETVDISAEIVGADFESDQDDIRLGLYTGNTHPLAEIACIDNDAGDGYGERVLLNLTGGTTYYFRVAPRNANQIISDVTFTLRYINEWTGTNSSDWAATGNWSRGSLPTDEEIIFVYNQANSPTINNGVNATAHGVVLLNSGDLTVAAGGTLTIDTDFFDGILIDGIGSVLTIAGTVNISNATSYGIEIATGTLDIQTGANLSIQNTVDDAIKSRSSNQITINGTVTIDNITADAFDLDADIVIGATGSVNITNIDYDGFAATAIDNSGTITINTCGRGISNSDLANSGIITIENAIDDGINTLGNTTSSNSGTITIDGVGADCIDNDATFNNSGTVILKNATDFVINDNIFVNQNDGILRAEGTINASSVNLESGSILEPGASPGCLSFEDNEDFSNTTINIEIDGTNTCDDYDQISVAGTVNLTDATLNLSGTHTATLGEVFVILSNDQADAVTGEFAGLQEGAMLSLNGINYSISYQGGDGNDVVLTAESVLPVDLLVFSAEVKGKDVMLNWLTAMEQNADRFEIEHSRHGTDFKEIGNVTAIGESRDLTTYDFLHREPAQGTHYYRLRQVDKDGAFAYSAIQSIEIKGAEAVFSIYPNPTADVVNINTDRSDYEIELKNTEGKVISSSRNISRLDLGSLDTGIYYLLLNDEDGRLLSQQKLSLMR